MKKHYGQKNLEISHASQIDCQILVLSQLSNYYCTKTIQKSILCLAKVMLKLSTNHLMEPLHITKLSVSCFGLINKRRIVILDPRALLAPKVGSELTSKMFIYLTQTSIRFSHDFPTLSSLFFLLKIIQKYFFTRWILVVMVTDIAEILPSLLDFFEISVCI